MRKLWIGLLSALLFASGCADRQGSDMEAMRMAYKGYYSAIESRDRFERFSAFYSVEGQMSKMPDGTYRYYITIDEPQVAMYEVIAMAVENQLPYETADKMMPTMGILEDKTYHMIPYQYNSSAGYVKGMILSGETNAEPISVRLLVEWKDVTKEKTVREFLEFSLGMDGFQAPHGTESAE